MAKQSNEDVLESGVVHFRIAEDFGILLTQIAQEHLTENNNPVQALKTITESLMGCPTDMAVLILKGDIVLVVDVKEQNVMPVERQEGIHDMFPRIDPVYFIESRTKKILSYGELIRSGLREIQNKIRKDRGIFNFNVSYEDLFKFIAGNDENMLEELRDNREVDAISCHFAVTKRFIEETMKTQSTIEWVMKTFDEFKDGENNEKYLQLRGDIADLLTDINHDLNQTLKLNFSLDEPQDDVQSYIEAAQEIDKVIEKGIEPVDIMENWSAGWLSPDGDFYGLNGEYANMLHVQIADALIGKGLIPEDILNPDSWLEERGWVKIHGQFVHFCGCNNFRTGKKNVDMTAIQIKKIYEYISLCHNCIMKLGWKQQVVTAPRFQLIAENNMEHMNKEYFEY